MKIISVVGARPNFMKVAPIIVAIKARNRGVGPINLIHHVLVHTGQHYDQLMSDAFFSDLNLPKPDVHLGVGSGSHAAQTAEIMRKFEEVLLRERPDVLLVVGDVNSTLACALVAAKISFDATGARPIIAHVEAGLRSFDRSMPEEINRILTDHLSDLLFVTEESGLHNLAQEGVPTEKIHFVGNTMIDSLLAYKDKAESSTILDELGLRDGLSKNGHGPAMTPYALLTLHRPANVDGREAFLNILEGLKDLAAEYPVVFPAHPRTRKRIQDFGLEEYFALDHESRGTGAAIKSGAIHMIEPLGYLDFLCLMKKATLVVTDSGGIQEETTCLGVPCVTVREHTERPITLKVGTNTMAGIRTVGIRSAISRQLQRKPGNGLPDKWDGKSAARILEVIDKEARTEDVVSNASRLSANEQRRQ
jgi:UDP-N-acetylglucosamine 2-epimerase (non-hydrolysing)